MQNSTIKIVKAITKTNSVAKNSRVTGTEIYIGKAVYSRLDGFQDDAIFYENILIGGKLFRPMLYTKQNIIILDCVNSSRTKSIDILVFEII
jgi:hypothetical protein